MRNAIITVYDAWWDKRAPARTRFERAAATAARKRAIAGNWCAAAALDDDLLDLPGYLPGRAGCPPPAPAPPPISARRPASTARAAHDQRRPLYLGLIHEVLDVLERHGYRRSDSEHTAQAIGLIHHVATIYEGALDAPRRAPSRRRHPR